MTTPTPSKKVTAQAVGRALLKNYAHQQRQIINRRSPGGAKPLFTQAELDDMVAGLATERDIATYNAYVSLYQTLVKYQAIAQMFFQQAQNGLFRLATFIMGAQQAEDAYDFFNSLPLVLTPGRYQALQQENTLRARRQQLTYAEITLWALDYYTKLYAQSPRKKNPLKEHLKAMRRTPAANAAILESYAAQETAIREEQARAARLRLETAQPQAMELARQYLGEYADASTALALRRELDGAPAEDDRQEGGWQAVDPKAGLTQFDVALSAEKFAFYSSAEGFAAFLKDFPREAEVLSRDILRTLGIAAPNPAGWDTPCATYAALLDADAYGFNALVNNDFALFPSSPVDPALRGVALLRPGDSLMACSGINQNGVCSEPSISYLFNQHDLSTLTHDEESRGLVTQARDELFLPAVSQVYAYNAFFRLAAEIYRVEDLNYLACGEDFLLERVCGLNALYLSLVNSLYGTGGVKQQKLGQARALFPLVNLETLRPKPAAIQAARGVMEDLQIYKNGRPNVISILLGEE